MPSAFILQDLHHIWIMISDLTHFVSYNYQHFLNMQVSLQLFTSQFRRYVKRDLLKGVQDRCHMWDNIGLLELGSFSLFFVVTALLFVLIFVCGLSMFVLQYCSLFPFKSQLCSTFSNMTQSIIRMDWLYTLYINFRRAPRRLLYYVLWFNVIFPFRHIWGYTGRERK